MGEQAITYILEWKFEQKGARDGTDSGGLFKGRRGGRMDGREKQKVYKYVVNTGRRVGVRGGATVGLGRCPSK